MILRPEITMKSCAHESIFCFIPRHKIKTCTEYSEYGGVCMKVMSRSIWNQSLLEEIASYVFLILDDSEKSFRQKQEGD